MTARQFTGGIFGMNDKRYGRESAGGTTEQSAEKSLILGGAAVYRCGEFSLLIAGFSPRGHSLDFFRTL